MVTAVKNHGAMGGIFYPEDLEVARASVRIWSLAEAQMMAGRKPANPQKFAAVRHELETARVRVEFVESMLRKQLADNPMVSEYIFVVDDE